MSSLPISAIADSKPATDSARPEATLRTPGWLREPLLHFLLLGGALFGIDHYVVGLRDDPDTIVITTEVDDEIEGVFETASGREPSPQEMTSLQQIWLDNEVLYREGLAMQLDKGDDAIRERVIFKALSVIDANTKLPAYDDEVLRAWFESHRNKYDEPARYDFQEAVLSGDNSEAAVRAFAARLNSAETGEANAGLRVFKGRPQANLEQSYGSDFVAALAQSPTGAWQALPAGKGWRAIRLEGLSPPKPADFQALRGIVLQDWTDATMAEQRTAAVRALAKKYRIKFEVVSE
ncbi:peptidyl-prolyl cis-trans isomerase [Methylomonas rhizoryzae]|uniref:peptidylprolyl isomerase n=1 Tax=Methylomonas rhizoryzae TaxID=2608981 RepID=UPI001231FF0F|nr:peptidylprolyl isomerase [Methylomonas rhizoryzae]